MFIKNNLLRKMQFIYHQDLFINIVIALLTKVYSDVWYAFKLFYSQSNIYDVFTPLIIVRYMQFIRFKTVLFLSIIFNSIYTSLNTNYFIRFPIFHSFVDILYRKNVNVCPVKIIVFLKMLFHACIKSSKILCTDGSQGIHFSGFLILYMNHNYHILFLSPHPLSLQNLYKSFNSKLYLLFYRRNVTLHAV